MQCSRPERNVAIEIKGRPPPQPSAFPFKPLKALLVGRRLESMHSADMRAYKATARAQPPLGYDGAQIGRPAHAHRRAPRCRRRDQPCPPMHATAEADAMADAAPGEGGAASEATEMSGNSYAAVMDIEQIKKVLPHRHAFGSPCTDQVALRQAGSRSWRCAQERIAMSREGFAGRLTRCQEQCQTCPGSQNLSLAQVSIPLD